MQVQQGGGNVLEASRSATAALRGGLVDDGDDDDESRRKRDSNPMDKIDDDDKVMEEVEKEIEIQDPIPPKKSKPTQKVMASTSGVITPSHFLILTIS